MTLTERLHADMTAAMRAHDDERRDALRMAIAALQLAAKTARRPLSDDEALAVLAREVKVRRESADAFANGDRPALAAREEAAIALLTTYMPERLSDDELDQLVRATIAEAGATSPGDLGKVMKLLAPRVRGRADGRAASERVVRELAVLAGAGGAPRPDRPRPGGASPRGSGPGGGG